MALDEVEVVHPDRTGATLLVDGTNLLMRAIKAKVHLGTSDEAEVATGPLLLFINMLARYIAHYRPSSVVVCWDQGRSAYRTTVFPDYKARRSTPEHEVEVKESSFALAHEFLDLARIDQFSIDGFEADDLIASFVCIDASRNYVILSGDRDLLQLVYDDYGHWVIQARPGTSESIEAQEYDYERVVEEFGCSPGNLRYVKALAGDTSDDVPGIRGVGIKTAVKFLAAAEFDWERMWCDPPAKIAGEEAVAEMNLRLVDLVTLPWLTSINAPGWEPVHYSLPLLVPFNPVGPGGSAYQPEDYDALLAFLDRYEMQSVKDRLVGGRLWRPPSFRKAG